MDYDAIVIGGGPAGLAAATHLAQAKYRVLLLEKQAFGGWVMNIEWAMNYPAKGQKMAGAALAAELIDRCRQSGVRMQAGEGVEVESYSRVKSVTCRDGKTYTGAALILAGGMRSKPLGVPGEDRLEGKGMIHCAACDASLYAGKVVAVCGGGRAGVVEAMLLANHASKVFLIEAQADLSALPKLKEQARAHPKLEIRCSEKPVEVHGDQHVTGLEVVNSTTGRKELLAVDGVLVHVGFEADTGFLGDVVALDEGKRVAVNEQLGTEDAGIFAAGDIRGGTPIGVASALSDGAIAAASAQQYLEKRKQQN